MSKFHISFSYLNYYKKQTLSVLLGIILSAALLSGMGGLLHSGRNAAYENAKAEYGDWDYSVRTDLPKMPWYKEYLKSPEGKGFEIEKTGLEIIRKEIKKPFAMQFVYADSGYLDMMGQAILKGHYPVQENEVAMDAQTLKNLGAAQEIGTEITLDGDAFVLSGIVEEMPEKLPELLGGDVRHVFVNSTLDYGKNGEFFTVKFRENRPVYKQIQTFSEKYRIDLSRVSRNNGTAAYTGGYQAVSPLAIIKEGIPYKEAGIPYIRGSLNENGRFSEAVILIALALFGAFILYSVFHVSVIRRMSEYSVMQTLGMTDGGNTVILFGELLSICLLGYPLGCLLGNLAAWLVYGKAGRIFIFQGGAFHTGAANSVNEFAVSSLPDAGNYYIANFKVMLYGLFFFTAVILCISIFLPLKMKRLSIHQMLSADTIKLRDRKIHSQKNRGLTGLLTYRFMCSRKETFAGILLSLSIGSVIFLGAFYFTENTKTNNELTFKADDGLGSDIQIYEQPDTLDAVIPEQDMEEIEKTDGIRQFHLVRYLLGEIPLNNGKLVWTSYFADVANDPSNPPDENLREKYNGLVVQTGEDDYKIKVNLYGYDDEMLEALNDYLLEGTIDSGQMKKENSVIVKTVMDGQGNYDGIDIHINDILDVKTLRTADVPAKALKFQGKRGWYQEKRLKVSAIASRPLAKVDAFIGDDGTDEVDLIMTNEQMKENFGVTDYRTISISLEDGKNGEKAAEQIQRIVVSVNGCVVKDYRMQIQAQNLFLTQKMFFCYGISAILLAVSLIHIINSLQYLVAEREREFGILRAMGITDSGFLKMMAKEGIRYGVCSGLTVLILYFFVQKVLYYFMLHVYLYLHPQEFISAWILPVVVIVNILLCMAAVLAASKGVLKKGIIREIQQ